MRLAARSPFACTLLIAITALAGCRGGSAAQHDSLGLDTSATWSEPAVFGFADAAFALLVSDGEIGIRSARRAAVRQLATRMQRDYRQLAGRTDSLADARSIIPRMPPGSDLTMQHRAAASDLRNESRRPFDDRYLDHVVTGHQRIIDRMYEALSAAQNDSVRALLDDAQRRLEANLSEAARLKAQVSRSTRRSRP